MTRLGRSAGSVAAAAVAAYGCVSDSGDPGGSPASRNDAGAEVASPSAPAPPPGWAEVSDPSQGLSFRYPPEIGAEYISAVDWPPLLRLEPGPFECTEAGSETARAGRTEPLTVDGRDYCVTRVTEGAAGSLYTMYAYGTPIDDGVAFLTFSLRAVQCANYDEPSRSECERERTEFSVDALADRVARTIRVTGSPAATGPAE